MTNLKVKHIYSPKTLSCSSNKINKKSVQNTWVIVAVQYSQLPAHTVPLNRRVTCHPAKHLWDNEIPPLYTPPHYCKLGHLDHTNRSEIPCIPSWTKHKIDYHNSNEQCLAYWLQNITNKYIQISLLCIVKYKMQHQNCMRTMGMSVSPPLLNDVRLPCAACASAVGLLQKEQRPRNEVTCIQACCLGAVGDFQCRGCIYRQLEKQMTSHTSFVCWTKDSSKHKSLHLNRFNKVVHITAYACRNRWTNTSPLFLSHEAARRE